MILPPNKEQMLFSQLQVAEGIINYTYENIDGTLFEENGETSTLLAEACIVMSRALIEMHSQMVKSCSERKSVCY